MTVSTTASRCAAPTTQATTDEARAFALLQATSDATMAKLYLSKGNIAAARRKTVQLLKALQVLEVASASSPCTKCRDNFPLPVAMDYFDQRVIADYTQRRTSCTAVPDADKPCLRKGGAV